MAAVDYFLKIDGIEGESQDAKHKGEIDLESFSWGETQSGKSHELGGGGSGRVVMQDFHFTMKSNKSSPKVMLACATGEHIPKAVLVCRKAGKEQQEFLKVTMTDLLVSSFRTGGDAKDDILPIDEVKLNFAKIEFEYREQKKDGTLGGPIKTGWDLKQNKKV